MQSILLLRVTMGAISKCVSPSAAQPWWGLQGSLATALLPPLPPCSRRPGASLPIWPVLPHPRDMSWALTKAAALTGLHLPSPVCSPFFVSGSSSSHDLAPLLSEHVRLWVAFASVGWVQGLWSRCSGMAAVAPDLAFCLLHLLAIDLGTAQS